MPAPLRRGLVACALIYATVVVANGLLWEHAHDEGTTFQHAIGPVNFYWLPAGPLPVTDLYALVDGDGVRPPDHVLDALMIGAGMHPPAYYLALNRWAAAVGTGTVRMRLPVYLAGVLSVLGIALLARHLIPVPGADTWAALFLAISPWFVGLSNFTRPYVFALCIALWSTLALVEFASGGRRPGWRAAFVLLSVLGLYTIYHYGFVLVWQSIVLAQLAWRRPAAERRREFVALVGMAGIVALGFLPWVPRLLGHLEVIGTRTWYFSGALPPHQWLPAAADILLVFGLGEALTTRLGTALALALLALAAVTMPLFVLSFSREGRATLSRPARLIWYNAPLLPALVILADVLRDTHTILITKANFALLPLLVLALVRAWATHESRRLRLAGLGASAVLLGVALASNLYTRAATQTDYERLAAHLLRSDVPSHVVVLSANMPGYTIPLLLTLRDAGVRHVRVVRAPGTELPAEIERLTTDPGVRTISLVNLQVLYPQSEDWDPAQTEIWDTPLLNRALRGIRSEGWRVAAPGTDAGDLDRSVWVAPSVQVKFFWK